MHGLITNPLFKIPQLAPDGNYCPNAYISGDINDDGIVNILDILILIDIILNDDTYIENGDINGDGGINISDIILLINLILDN